MADHAAIEIEQPKRRAINRFDRRVSAHRYDTGGDALQNCFDIPAALIQLEVLPLEIEPRALEFPLAGGQLPGHRVESLDERSELISRLGLDAMIETTGADLTSPRRQQLHRAGDSLRQVQ